MRDTLSRVTLRTDLENRQRWSDQDREDEAGARHAPTTLQLPRQSARKDAVSAGDDATVTLNLDRPQICRAPHTPMDFLGGKAVNAGKRVLLVDDEQEVLCGESMWLTAAGFATQPAKDGVEGLEAAIRERPDAIVLDVRMPRKDGLTVMAELQQLEETKDIPVVMLSASLSDQQRALDAGASFFLPKPYVGKTLVAAVQAAVQHARERQPRSAAISGDTQ